MKTNHSSEGKGNGIWTKFGFSLDNKQIFNIDQVRLRILPKYSSKLDSGVKEGNSGAIDTRWIFDTINKFPKKDGEILGHPIAVVDTIKLEETSPGVLVESNVTLITAITHSKFISLKKYGWRVCETTLPIEYLPNHRAPSSLRHSSWIANVPEIFHDPTHFEQIPDTKESIINPNLIIQKLIENPIDSNNVCCYIPKKDKLALSTVVDKEVEVSLFVKSKE